MTNKCNCQKTNNFKTTYKKMQRHILTQQLIRQNATNKGKNSSFKLSQINIYTAAIKREALQKMKKLDNKNKHELKWKTKQKKIQVMPINKKVYQQIKMKN